MGSKVEVFQGDGDGGDWRFRVVAANGEIVAQSEGYTTKDAAQDAIHAMYRAVQDAQRE